MKIQFELVFNQLTPVYMQIVEYFKIDVAAKKIANGDELPSRRDLAIILAINPNTVQKAYAILQEEGLIATSATSKSLAIVTDETRKKIMVELSGDMFGKFIEGTKKLGMDMEQVIAVIKKRWDNE